MTIPAQHCVKTGQCLKLSTKKIGDGYRYECTRKMYHSGRHMACNIDEHRIRVWA